MMEILIIAISYNGHRSTIIVFEHAPGDVELKGNIKS